jgi:hypothetical protein
MPLRTGSRNKVSVRRLRQGKMISAEVSPRSQEMRRGERREKGISSMILSSDLSLIPNAPFGQAE